MRFSNWVGRAAGNPADFLPILGWIGYGENEKKMVKIMTETKKILQGLVDEHRSGNGNDRVDNNSLIDHLLSLQRAEPEYYTDDIINGLVRVSEIIPLLHFDALNFNTCSKKISQKNESKKKIHELILPYI